MIFEEPNFRSSPWPAISPDPHLGDFSEQRERPDLPGGIPDRPRCPGEMLPDQEVEAVFRLDVPDIDVVVLIRVGAAQEGGAVHVLVVVPLVVAVIELLMLVTEDHLDLLRRVPGRLDIQCDP